MSELEVDDYAKQIWDFHQMKMKPVACDAIFTLCSLDARVAEYAAKLYLKGLGGYLIFSGGIAHSNDLLKVDWQGSEADHFADIAISLGVPRDKIIVENQAQNTGENIRFTYELLTKRGLHPTSLLLLQKPYMERRTYATFKKQWPKAGVKIIVTSPPISYDEYFNQANPKDLVINIMVGDLERISVYPDLGYQIKQAIPRQVFEAYQNLVRLGYTHHLIK